MQELSLNEVEVIAGGYNWAYSYWGAYNIQLMLREDLSPADLRGAA
ncbi:MAG: hypothetical protein HYZ45_02305 [Burkholderiales bacterium]|nr:hypothetical protein [Burkholderiales bacterium]